MKSIKLPVLFVFILLLSCKSNLNNVYFTNSNAIYCNDSLRFWHKMDLKEFENANQKQKSTKNEVFLYAINQAVSVYQIKNKSVYLSKLKSKKLLDFKIDSLSNEANFLSNFSRNTTVNYRINTNVFTDELITLGSNVLLFRFKNNSYSEVDKKQLFSTITYDPLAFLKKATPFEKQNFLTSYFENSYPLIENYFRKSTEIDRLNTLKSQSEKAYFIGNLIQIGDYTNTVAFRNANFKNQAVKWNDSIVMSAIAVEEINNFCKKLNDVDIVLLNEDHLFEDSRFTAALFVTYLKDLGFTNLAAETFFDSKRHENTNFAIQPENLIGHYLNNPTFGLLTHVATKNNYQLIGYDYFEDCSNLNRQKCRDSLQAVHIAAAVNHPNYKGKMIVFAGHSHVYTKKHKNFTPMGYYLKQLLPNKKIIAIDQVRFSSSSGEKDAFVSKMKSSLTLKKPVLFHYNGSFSKINNEYVDFSVLHPENEVFNYWYFTKNDVNDTKIEFDIPKTAKYIEIVPKNSPLQNAVFRTFVSNLKQRYIYLPNASYQINFFNANYKKIEFEN
jgi:hypothetical protein